MPKHLVDFELDVDRMFLVILCMADTISSAVNTMHSVDITMHGAADMMRGVANVGCSGLAGISVTPPPIWQKISFF